MRGVGQPAGLAPLAHTVAEEHRFSLVVSAALIGHVHGLQCLSRDCIQQKYEP